jgi:hypothetical protein
MSLVDLAGLSDVVKVIVGSSDESIARLTSSGQLKHIDLMFLDHYKPAYTTDLKLCEELGLITKGSVLAADNVIKPGNPPYLEYVRSSVDEKVKKAKEGGDSHVEGIAETNVKMYEKRYGKANFSESKGNPNLVYESKLVNSYEPTGVPVSMPKHPTSFEAMTDLLDTGRHRDHQVCWLERGLAFTRTKKLQHGSILRNCWLYCLNRMREPDNTKLSSAWFQLQS